MENSDLLENSSKPCSSWWLGQRRWGRAHWATRIGKCSQLRPLHSLTLYKPSVAESHPSSIYRAIWLDKAPQSLSASTLREERGGSTPEFPNSVWNRGEGFRGTCLINFCSLFVILERSVWVPATRFVFWSQCSEDLFKVWLLFLTCLLFPAYS